MILEICRGVRPFVERSYSRQIWERGRQLDLKGRKRGVRYEPLEGIRRGWDAFKSCTNIAIGDGARTKFWFDTWYGVYHLKDSFPFFVWHFPS